MRVFTALVVLPTRIPESVVEPVPPRATASVPVVSESAIPKVEVANAVTFPVEPVLFPRIELAAMVASLVSAMPLEAKASVEFAPPTNAPMVPPTVNSPDGVKVVVATEVRPFVPFP